MNDPVDIVEEAARAVTGPAGDPAFQSVIPRAELPGEGEYPAFLITMSDRQTGGAAPHEGPSVISQDAQVRAIIYLSVEEVDLETEDRTQNTWADARGLLKAFLYELYREDPINPETGDRLPQARAPAAILERVQESTRTVEGKSRYAIGFELTMPGQMTPEPLT